MRGHDRSNATPRIGLVFSAGGLYGAYQVGAWKVLSRVLQPDLVVGTSVGSLNGWAVAGNLSPQALEQRWLHLPEAARHSWRRPKSWTEGILDDAILHRWIEELHSGCCPAVPFGIVVTETLRLRPHLLTSPGLTWRHLAASCAVLGVLSQQRLNGVVYSDGGLFNALPLWAAEQMGATLVVGVNAMPALPFLGPVLRGLRRWRGVAPGDLRSGANRAARFVLSPSESLGGVRDCVYWSESRVRKSIALGERDAERALPRLLPLLRQRAVA